MAGSEFEAAESLGLDQDRWEAALSLAEDWCRRDLVPAVAVTVGRAGGMVEPRLFGRLTIDGMEPLPAEAVFLVASITKPIVAMGALRLVERGELLLGERVADYLPEFGRHGKIGTTIRHLLTHTSGLPDMLPDNRERRIEHAPLTSFVEGACALRPGFPPGRGVQYQSLGFAVLGEIVSRITGKSLAAFLHDELFAPLGMHDTALGAPAVWFSSGGRSVDIPEVRLPSDQQDGADWNWNSAYWRQLGAPWGGLLTTPADLGRFARMMLGGGALDGVRVLSSATIAAATRNQLEAMRDLSELDRRCRPWGLGWRLNWPAHSDSFGDLVSPHAYGHWGATGTLTWVDPDRDAFAVLLTTQPTDLHGRRYLQRLSNAVAAAFRS